MRILQVLPHLSKGGAERVVVELSNSLVDIGHEVTLLLAYPVNPALNQQYLDKSIKVQFISPKSGNRVLGYIRLPFFIFRESKNLKNFDVVHCHLTFGLVFGFFFSFFRKLSRKNNLQLIATCHVVGIDISRTRRIMNERLSYFFDEFVLMAQDSQWRDFVTKKNRKNFQIVFNGISTKIWTRQSKQPNRKSFWTVGTISRLQSERQPWLFLEVFSEVNKLMNGEVRFILGGDGPEKDSLAALSEKLNLNKTLSMPGLVQDPKTILDFLDLYIGLNVEEITGIAGLEAVFSGVPVIGVQLAPTYISGNHDWIWSNQNPILIAQRIVKLLQEPSELSTLAEEQYRVASERFSVESMRDKYLSIYTSRNRLLT